MSAPGRSSGEARPTIDDLSRAILAWLDQRPRGFGRRMPSSSWSTQELQDSFRANLSVALHAAVSARKLAAVVAYLIDAFSAVTTSSEIAISRWSIALREGSSQETFDAMRQDITTILERRHSDHSAAELQPGEFADLIVQALDGALSDEAGRIPEEHLSPAGVLNYYMIPLDVQRVYNVRTFLFFLGAAVFAFIVYAIAEPGLWFNPGTSLFVLLAYATLIVTAVVYDRSKVKVRERRYF